MNRTLDWDVIGEVARSLGVRDSAFQKWKERRSVPHKWRLPIIRNSEGRMSLDAFDGASDESAHA